MSIIKSVLSTRDEYHAALFVFPNESLQFEKLYISEDCMFPFRYSSGLVLLFFMYQFVGVRGLSIFYCSLHRAWQILSL